MYDEVAAYFLIGDYSPAIALIASVIIIFVVYMFILRPLLNFIILIGINTQPQVNKRVIIKDKKYSFENINNMREELLKKEYAALEEELAEKGKNLLNKIANLLHAIVYAINKMFNSVKTKRINQKNSKKSDIIEDYNEGEQNQIEET
jgi:nitrate/nitrite-specific signal transduction histidine kinase